MAKRICSNAAAEDTPYLPEEMIREVVLRLPVKDIVRFKCMSKSFLARISDPQFAKLHFDGFAVSNRLLARVDGNKGVSISTEESLAAHPPPSTAFHPLPPPLQTPPDVYDEGPIGFWGSCRGFLLLERDDKVVVWNPTTSLHKNIPMPLQWADNLFNLQCVRGFVYDSATDDYLVIIIVLPNTDAGGSPILRASVNCFSLKSNSWNHTEVNVQRPYKGYLSTGSFLDGALHWVVECLDTELRAIIAFDLVQRSISEVPLPPELREPEYFPLKLLVIEGCSVCFTHAEDTVMS